MSLAIRRLLSLCRCVACGAKRLESDGLVHRKSYETVPPHVEYSLTPLGRTVGKRVEALADCIETSLPDIMDARRLSEPAAAGSPVG